MPQKRPRNTEPWRAKTIVDGAPPHQHVSSLVAATNHHPDMPCPPKEMFHHKNPIICSHFEGPTCVMLEKSQQTTTDTKHPATPNSASTRGLNPKSRKVTRKTMRLEKGNQKANNLLLHPTKTKPLLPQGNTYL